MARSMVEAVATHGAANSEHPHLTLRPRPLDPSHNAIEGAHGCSAASEIPPDALQFGPCVRHSPPSGARAIRHACSEHEDPVIDIHSWRNTTLNGKNLNLTSAGDFLTLTKLGRDDTLMLQFPINLRIEAIKG
ncbi:hypothetical protein VPH35_009943 [Triticum aestivum]